MHIVTPTEIECVAWEGELAAPETSRSLSKPPVVTIGHPEVWTAAEALESEVDQRWVPPMGDAQYWLVRLAFTLRDPSGLRSITEALQTLSLRPRNSQAARGSTYAYSLFPDRLTVEDRAEFSIGLGAKLKFDPAAELDVGQLGAKIDYRKVFPVIQSYGAGEPDPYWIFKPHPKHPLMGSQFVYAVVVAKAGAEGIQARVDLRVETSVMRFALSREAREHTRFSIPFA